MLCKGRPLKLLPIEGTWALEREHRQASVQQPKHSLLVIIHIIVGTSPLLS